MFIKYILAECGSEHINGTYGYFSKNLSFLFEPKNHKQSFEDAIRIIRTAGGVPVLAHPGREKAYTQMIKEWENDDRTWFKSSGFTPYLFVSYLKSLGLAGIEQYYYEGQDDSHKHCQDRINRYFCRMADELGLIMTYGTDCHGPQDGRPRIGRFGSFASLYPTIKQMQRDALKVPL